MHDAVQNELLSMVRGAARGEVEHQAELCRRLLPAIRAFARRRVGAHEAEDFAQEALLVLLDQLRAGELRNEERVAGFALGVCRNLLRDRARVSARRRALWERYAPALAAATVEEPALLDQDRLKLEDCLSQLTERARQVIRRTWYDEEDASRIADALAMSEGNVRVVRHRALAALRDCMSRPISWEGAR